MSETLHTTAGRPTLRIERRLAHPPEKVWRAITDPAHLSQWYPFAATALDLRVGGMIRFDDGQGTVMDAVITELVHLQVFAFSERAPAEMSRESNDLVRFELHADGVGSRLIFTHTFDDRPAAASYGAGWQVCLDALEQVVAEQPITLPGRMDTLHESLIKAFGLEAGVAEQLPEGWRVRFERQLVRPIATVWAALADAPGQPAPVAGTPPPPAFTTVQITAGAVKALDPPTLLEYAWLCVPDGTRPRRRTPGRTATGAVLTARPAPHRRTNPSNAIESGAGYLARPSAQLPPARCARDCVRTP